MSYAHGGQRQVDDLITNAAVDYLIAVALDVSVYRHMLPIGADLAAEIRDRGEGADWVYDVAWSKYALCDDSFQENLLYAMMENIKTWKDHLGTLFPGCISCIASVQFARLITTHRTPSKVIRSIVNKALLDPVYDLLWHQYLVSGE